MSHRYKLEVSKNKNERNKSQPGSVLNASGCYSLTLPTVRNRLNVVLNALITGREKRPTCRSTSGLYEKKSLLHLYYAYKHIS